MNLDSIYEARAPSGELCSQGSTASPSTSHSQFAKIDPAQDSLIHKQTALRRLFNMTPDNHTSHDRLQRVRGFTIRGKSWTCETENNHAISSTTHFKLGDLFTTLICHNSTHLGLAVVKSTLIKRGGTGSGSRAVSLFAIPRAEIHLPTSAYTVSGQVLSLLPLETAPNSLSWAWEGDFISFCSKKKKKKKASDSEDTAKIKNLHIIVSSRLIDCNINDQAREISGLTLPREREKTWSFKNADLVSAWKALWVSLLNDSSLHDKFPVYTGISEGMFPYQAVSPVPANLGICYASSIANTAIEKSILARKACRICGKQVKDQDRQGHVGVHILKSMYGERDLTANVPVSSDVSSSYPCGMCGGTCTVTIKGGKPCSEQCPTPYSFLISASKKFLPTRPCTNVPVLCAVLGCKDTHWKYNFKQHLEERHPGWQQIIPAESDFLEQIRISSEEQAKLDISPETISVWPPLPPPPPSITSTRPSTPNRDAGSGRKRSASYLQNSPSRRDKENCDPNTGYMDKRRHILGLIWCT
ncbi:hypothetical protein R3P38DRAFT_2495678 [Favolaschia claudopus]|uniref:C2H2-type domain-containing protein n=1 Tax=Favolaschia claudopus TaxID=2862362 RepID=A0AAW0E6B1_9AGAR